MSKERTVILSTGIPGLEKSTYFKEMRKIAKANGKDIKVYHVGDMLLKLAKENDPCFINENVLNMPPNTLELMVNTVYDDIERDIENHECSLISTHASFFWKDVFYDSGNARFLEMVKPDIYITLVQAADKVEAVLKKSKQWKTQDLSERDILHWQNVETMVTEKYWAGTQKTRDGKRARYLVIPRYLPEEEVFKLFLDKDVEFVYSAFPMTNLTNPDESFAKIDDFQKRLREYFAVIDPKALDLKFNASEVANNQTVHRDLDNFVGLTTKTICYFPEEVLSTGALTEITIANARSRDVFYILDEEVAKTKELKGGGKRLSPFPAFNSKEIFWSVEEFFDYLHDQGYKKLKIKK